jgi:hypothetical protein
VWITKTAPVRGRRKHDWFCLEPARAIAVAIAAEDIAVTPRFEGQLGDVDSTLSTLQSHRGDVMHLARRPGIVAEAGTRGWLAIAVAIAAVDVAVTSGLERQLIDRRATLGALDPQSGDIVHLARRAGAVAVVEGHLLDTFFAR